MIPKWKKYLTHKGDHCTVKNNNVPRPDTIWKKILRDVREFYRILFRARFHHLDYQTQRGAISWTKILLKDLGIEASTEGIDHCKMFRYLHQTHLEKCRRIFGSIFKPEESSPFEVIETYNEETRENFMKNPVCSRLLYFVFMNYLEDYCMLVNLKYRKQVVSTLCLILNCYNKMREDRHIDRIEFILKAS